MFEVAPNAELRPEFLGLCLLDARAEAASRGWIVRDMTESTAWYTAALRGDRLNVRVDENGLTVAAAIF